MSRTPYYDENDKYFGPHGEYPEGIATGGGLVLTTAPVTGFVDTIIFDNGESSDTFDIAITRQFADESIYTKTGLSAGAIVRPAAPEVASVDGSALTSARRIWLQNEIVTIAITNATNGVAFTATILTTPH